MKPQVDLAYIMQTIWNALDGYDQGLLEDFTPYPGGFSSETGDITIRFVANDTDYDDEDGTTGTVDVVTVVARVLPLSVIERTELV